jgi:hypothetical protein
MSGAEEMGGVELPGVEDVEGTVGVLDDEGVPVNGVIMRYEWEVGIWNILREKKSTAGAEETFGSAWGLESSRSSAMLNLPFLSEGGRKDVDTPFASSPSSCTLAGAWNTNPGPPPPPSTRSGSLFFALTGRGWVGAGNMFKREDDPAPLLDVMRGFLAGGRSSVSGSWEGREGREISIFFGRFVFVLVGGGRDRLEEPDDLGGGRERPEVFDGAAGAGGSGCLIDEPSLSLSTSLP